MADLTNPTRTRILDAAERLFAEQGLEPTSLRTITAAAEVNLAAVHYHFGSKEALIEEVFARRLGPINAERLDRLEALERAATDQVLPLEGIIEAFVAPPLDLHCDTREGGESFMHLIGRFFTEPNLRPLILPLFEEVRSRFTDAFQRALPDLPEEELMWRLHFMIGAMAHTAGASQLIEHMSGGRCDSSDAKGTIKRLIAFVKAGLAAPPPSPNSERSP